MPIYRYPQNVGTPPFNKFIKFDAKRMRHFLRSESLDDTVASVVIYLPESALKSTISAAWDSVGLGAGLLPAALQSASTGGFGVISSLAAAKNQLDSAVGAAWNNASEAGGWGIFEAGFKNFSAEVASAAAPDNVKNLASAMGGININPRTEILFDSVQYRTYQFDFVLVPRSYQEAVQIDSIVKFFQFYMLPQFMDYDTVIGYPYEFEIGVFNNSTPDGNLPSSQQIRRVTHIGRSVIKNCTVDTAAAGKVAFVRDNDTQELFPVATSISLETQEVKLLSRKDPEILRGSPAPETYGLEQNTGVPYFPNPR